MAIDCGGSSNDCCKCGSNSNSLGGVGTPQLESVKAKTVVVAMVVVGVEMAAVEGVVGV